MKDFVQINRLTTKLLDLIAVVSKIHDTSKAIITSPTQDNIDVLTKLVTEFESSTNEIPECLVTFLKEVVQTDIEETDATETDVGYKIT